jgi:hypothetical protein
VRIPARDAKPRPRQLLLALPQLGRLRARCPFKGGFLLSFTENPFFDESIKIVSGGKTARTTFGAIFLRFSAPRRTVGREVVRETPSIAVTIVGDHEPFEVQGRARLRLAESRDGSPGCVTPELKATVTTRYH